MMNPNIERLTTIANKRKRLIIGLMSGTSLDGLDIALCSIEGSGLDSKLELLQFETVAYSDDFKKEIKTIFARKHIKLEKLCLLHPWIALQQAGFINDCLEKWNISSATIDLIASHGQTIYHAPLTLHRQEKFGNATLQIGDGDHMAVATGIITVSDFRQKHIAAGSEGAPLAAYGDYLLFGKKGEDRILLNIGGISNFTYLPASMEITRILCTDAGPGNTLMDAFMQQEFPGKYFDENAVLAKQGRVNDDLLLALKEDTFFNLPFPKTTGPELFNLEYINEARQISNTNTISVADTMATLNKFTADMIVVAINKCLQSKKGCKIFCSGGGGRNPLLLQHLKEQLLGYSLHSTAELGIPSDAKEAVLFAILANECVCGDPSFFGKGMTGMPAVSMGKISFPV